MGLKEGFEWGADGDHIHDSGGSITWTCSATPPVISTDQAHGGTRSAKFSGGAAQYMQCNQAAGPGYDISLWYYKVTGSGIARPIQHGNGTNRVRITVSGVNGRVGQYTDGGPAYYNLHSLDAWHKMSVKNINWAAATFDLYIDEILEHAGCPMETSALLSGIFQATTEDTTSGVPWYLDDFMIGKGGAFGSPAGRLVAARLV